LRRLQRQPRTRGDRCDTQRPGDGQPFETLTIDALANMRAVRHRVLLRSARHSQVRLLSGGGKEQDRGKDQHDDKSNAVALEEAFASRFRLSSRWLRHGSKRRSKGCAYM